MPPEIELISPEEQVTRKKPKILKPPEPPIVPKSPKSPIVPKIRKEPRIPTFVPERERRVGIPIIPGDPCCAKICETLNEIIDRKTDTLETVISLGGTYESKTYRYALYGKEALEDHRQDLKDKNICGCIEETGAVSVMVPLIRAAEAKNGKLAIRTMAGMLRVRPPEILRTAHRGEKSIIPTENACCPKSCELLNSEIETNNKILDKMELRGGPAAYKSPRYEVLSYRNFALQEYRDELKKRESCRCTE